MSGNTYLVQKILNIGDKDLNPNVKNSNGLTPLALIVRKGNLPKCYKKLIKKDISYHKIIKLLLSDERVKVSSTSLYDFFNELDIFYTNRAGFSDIGKKKCTLVYDIVKLFLIKKSKFKSDMYYRGPSIFDFIIDNFGFYQDIATYIEGDRYIDFSKNINAQKHHLLYLILEYGYVSEKEISKFYEKCDQNDSLGKIPYSRFNGNCDNIKKIIEMWRESSLDVKIPDE